jgi:hypothetical protein
MFQHAALTVVLILAALTGFVAAVDETLDPGRIAQLITANSHLDQQAILSDDKDYHYDFTKNKNYNFAPGGVANMNAATFPAAKIGGMTSESLLSDTPSLLYPHTPSYGTSLTLSLSLVAMLNLGPCSMLPPHYHPNAVNFVVAVLGNTTTYMYQETGARLVTEVLTPGHATIFPRASMHMMMNTGAFVIPFSSPPSPH